MSSAALLAFLVREPDGHARLLESSGDLVRAGHRLACAKLECWHSPTGPVPTATELHVAVREVAERGGHLGSVPTRHELKAQAIAAGLGVLAGRKDKWMR